MTDKSERNYWRIKKLVATIAAKAIERERSRLSAARFASRVSHGLRTPIASIKLATSEVLNGNDDDIAGALRLINAQASVLEELLENERSTYEMSPATEETTLRHYFYDALAPWLLRDDAIRVHFAGPEKTSDLQGLTLLPDMKVALRYLCEGLKTEQNSISFHVSWKDRNLTVLVRCDTMPHILPFHESVDGCIKHILSNGIENIHELKRTMKVLVVKHIFAQNRAHFVPVQESDEGNICFHWHI